MKKEEILQTLNQALATSRQVRVTFKHEAKLAVSFLLGMFDLGFINYNPGDGLKLMMLTAVRNSRFWEDDQNRKLTIVLTKTFDRYWFVERLGEDLEKIEVVS